MSSASVSRLSVHIPYSKLLTEEIVFTFEGVNVDLVACTSINYPIALASTLNTSALSGSVIDDSALKGGYAKDMDFVTAWIEQMISTVRDYTILLACLLLPLFPMLLYGSQIIPNLNLIFYPTLCCFAGTADNSGANRSERRNN